MCHCKHSVRIHGRICEYSVRILIRIWNAYSLSISCNWQVLLVLLDQIFALEYEKKITSFIGPNIVYNILYHIQI